MIGVLLLSHGHLCEGLLDTAKFLFGDNIEKVETIPLLANDSPEDYDAKIQNGLEKLDDGSGVLIMVDLMGGTPSNRSAFVMSEQHQVVTGMNLPLLLEFLGRREAYSNISEVDIDELVNASQNGIVSLNKMFSD